ncbi:sigma 54-interacting transcriptional regulator [Treponema sp.]|uniref:sigma-54-dependent transcriptional regulator n=1 Tax=Treponema sp. TaxID=166 RepID=UPI0025E55A7E|nr:sigma 54-interacting transcriptional regulator [Treponema sp.]MCR5219036.1 sigma 54-interacting transcriptional regulator [Treponema sp.]
MSFSDYLIVTKGPDLDFSDCTLDDSSWNNFISCSFSQLLSECRTASFKAGSRTMVFPGKYSERIFELQTSFPQLNFKRLSKILPEKKKNYSSFTISKKNRDYTLKISQAIHTKIPVLMIGESGSGKNHNARIIHNKSGMLKSDFFEININEINPNLMETTLFGSVRGAFTGSSCDTKGLFECAGKGSLFLDEISYLKKEMQAKLLGVLDKNSFRKVGGTKEIPSTARMIFATDSNLQLMVKEKKFMLPLFYRISVLIIKIPPLRERREDLSRLAFDFAREQKKSLSPGALKRLHSHHWPGNIRELKNCIQRACISCCGNTLQTEDIVFDHELFEND